MTSADLFSHDKSEWPGDENHVSHTLWSSNSPEVNLTYNLQGILDKYAKPHKKSFSHPQQSPDIDDWPHMNSLLYMCFMSSLSENTSRSPLDLLPLCRLHSVLSKLSARNNK